MSGPRPQIIICTNFFSSPTAPALIRAALSTHYRQPTVLHLWLSFSQTREILRRGAKTRDKASCERVNGAGTPRGEGGCYVRSNVVRAECGGGKGDIKLVTTLYNVKTNLRRSRMTNLMGGHQTLSSSGDARHLPGKQSTIPAPRLTFC